MEVSSTPLIVSLIASSPQPLEVVLIDEKLVITTIDYQQWLMDCCSWGHDQGYRRAHVSPIKPMVEHAYHQIPQRNMYVTMYDLYLKILLAFYMSLFWTNSHDVYLLFLYFEFSNIEQHKFYNIVLILLLFWTK